jgi:hypothetical protein
VQAVDGVTDQDENRVGEPRVVPLLLDRIDLYALGAHARVRTHVGFDRDEAPAGLESALRDLLQILSVSDRAEHGPADLLSTSAVAPIVCGESGGRRMNKM